MRINRKWLSFEVSFFKAIRWRKYSGHRTSKTSLVDLKKKKKIKMLFTHMYNSKDDENGRKYAELTVTEFHKRKIVANNKMKGN